MRSTDKYRGGERPTPVGTVLAPMKQIFRVEDENQIHHDEENKVFFKKTRCSSRKQGVLLPNLSQFGRRAVLRILLVFKMA